jgi:hypothetical protein
VPGEKSTPKAEGGNGIVPESLPMNTEDVRQIVAELDALIADAKKLHQSLRDPAAPIGPTAAAPSDGR